MRGTREADAVETPKKLTRAGPHTVVLVGTYTLYCTDTVHELLAVSHRVGTTTVSVAQPAARTVISTETPLTAAEDDLIDQELLALSDAPDDTHQQHLSVIPACT